RPNRHTEPAHQTDVSTGRAQTATARGHLAASHRSASLRWYPSRNSGELMAPIDARFAPVSTNIDQKSLRYVLPPACPSASPLLLLGLTPGSLCRSLSAER